MFLSQKRVQSIFLDFHAKLEQIFKTEVKANKKQLQTYLTLPHNQPSLDIKKEPSTRTLTGSFHTLSPGEPTFKVSAKFLDELPAIYKKKEEAMIEQLKKSIATDPEIQEQFEAIVNNTKLSFAQKVEALKELHGVVKNKNDANFARQIIIDKVGELKRMAQSIEDTNDVMAQDIG